MYIIYFTEEDNLVDQLKRFEIWDDILRARNLLIYHTESLMYNFNNNAAELYNSILAKFIGGKRVNLSQKGINILLYILNNQINYIILVYYMS